MVYRSLRRSRSRANCVANQRTRSRVARESPLHNLGVLAISKGNKYQADWLFGGAAGGTRNAGDSDPEGRLAALPNSFGKRGGHGAADGAIACQQQGRHAAKFALQRRRNTPALHP